MKPSSRRAFDLGMQIRRPLKTSRWGFWLGMIVWISLAIMLDQGSKYGIRSAVPMGESHRVLPFLSWTPTWNYGVSFGIGSQSSGWLRWILYAFIGVFLGALGAMYVRSSRRFERAGLGLMLAGALSNTLDRFYFGGVFDFIHLSWRSWDFPVLNVADMLITIGFLALFSGHFTWIGLKTCSKKH